MSVNNQVKHGTTDFTIGPFRYSTIPWIIIIITVICAAVIVVAVILAAVLYRKSESASKEVDNCLDDIDRVQRELGEDMRRGQFGSVKRLGWESEPKTW